MEIKTYGWNDFYDFLTRDEQGAVDDFITISAMLYPMLATLKADYDHSFMQFPITNNLILQIIYTDTKLIVHLRKNAVN